MARRINRFDDQRALRSALADFEKALGDAPTPGARDVLARSTSSQLDQSFITAFNRLNDALAPAPHEEVEALIAEVMGDSREGIATDPADFSDGVGSGARVPVPEHHQDLLALGAAALDLQYQAVNSLQAARDRETAARAVVEQVISLKRFVRDADLASCQPGDEEAIRTGLDALKSLAFNIVRNARAFSKNVGAKKNFGAFGDVSSSLSGAEHQALRSFVVNAVNAAQGRARHADLADVATVFMGLVIQEATVTKIVFEATRKKLIKGEMA